MENNFNLAEALKQWALKKRASLEEVPAEVEQIVEQQGPENTPNPAEPTGEMAEPGAGEPGDMVPGKLPVLPLLVAAYCAEVDAAWQYEWARISALGSARDYLVSECEEHRDEEWDHATKLAEMIDFFGGTIPFTLSQIEQQNPTPLPAEAPAGQRSTRVLAAQLVDAEEAAVALYSKIIETLKDGGPDAEVVINLVVDILTTEKKHVADMIKVSHAIGE